MASIQSLTASPVIRGSPFGMMDLFSLNDPNDIVEDGLDEDGDLDEPLTFQDFIASSQADFTFCANSPRFSPSIGLSIPTLEMSLCSDGPSVLHAPQFEAPRCLSVSPMGSVVAHISGHAKHCRQNSSIACCSPVETGSKLDFQVEHMSLSGCPCSHKQVYWISIKHLDSFTSLGEVKSAPYVNAISPLALAGFITLSGHVIDYSIGSFSLHISVNMDFVLMMHDSLTREQVNSFIEIFEILDYSYVSSITPDSRYTDFITRIMDQRDAYASAPLCDLCLSESDVQEVFPKSTKKRLLQSGVSTTTKKQCIEGILFPPLEDADIHLSSGTEKCLPVPRAKPIAMATPKKQRVKTKSGSMDSRTTDASSNKDTVKVLLEERRRKRALEQIAKCSDKGVAQLKEVIVTSASLGSRRCASMYGFGRGGSEEVSRYIQTLRGKLDSGRDALGALGELIGITKGIFEERLGRGRTGATDEWADAAHTWRHVLEPRPKRERIVAVPLASYLASLLAGLGKKYAHTSGTMIRELTQLSSLY